MLKRRLSRELPLFFTYTLFQAFRSGVQFYVFHWHSPEQYRDVYLELQAISAGLGFAVIYEIYAQIFRKYDAIRRLGWLLFAWTAIVLLMVAAVMASSSGSPDVTWSARMILTLERSVRLMQCGLLFFLFLFVRYFGLSWRHYAFGIGLGFGIFATVELLAVTFRMQLGSVAHNAFALANSAAYECAVLIWIGYLLLPQPAEGGSEPPKYDLEAWNRALLQLLTR